MNLRQVNLAVVAVTLLGGVAPADDVVEAGRLIYEQGILPSGDLLIATRPEGLILEGQYAACTTCHRRSGMGSVEGIVSSAILVPPLAGPLLFAPGKFANSFLDETHHYVPHITWRRAMTRPAYDPATFADALRNGVNSSGEALDAPMPHYDLDEESAAALVAYLQQLTSEPAPGVDQDRLHVATIITPHAHPDDADSVLGVLRAWAKTAGSIAIPWKLHEWRLRGEPDTWQRQLDDYYASQPVFAVVSGAGGVEWQPVHDFCERRRLPCLMPSVQAAPRDRDAWYSVYFSPGISLEAKILARHLLERPTEGRIVQIAGGAVGRHAATEFSQAMAGRDVEISTRTFRSISPLAALGDLRPDDTIVLWLRAEHVNTLTSLFPDASNIAQVYLAGLLAPPKGVALPPIWRSRTRFVTLFDDLTLQAEIAQLRLARWLRQNGLDTTLNRRVQADAYAASYLFDEALEITRRQEERRPPVPLSREHVLEILEDVLSKFADGTTFIDTEIHVAWYGRMSLGPNQRIATRGGRILRYADARTDRLEAVGERIVPR